MPLEWKYTAEWNANDDWKGTQVTLSGMQTKNPPKKQQTSFFLSCIATILSPCIFYNNSQICLEFLVCHFWSSSLSPSHTLSWSVSPFLLFRCSYFQFPPFTLFHVSCVSSTSPPSGIFINHTVETWDTNRAQTNFLCSPWSTFHSSLWVIETNKRSEGKKWAGDG